MSMSIRLLIIEDSEDDCALALRALSQAGYEVHSQRVETAAALAKALNSNWDVIISDHSLPHFSGSEALRIVRAQDADVPFIFLSGTTGEDIAVEAMRKGAQDYVMKSNLQRLVPAIERELQEAHNRLERKQLDKKVQQLQKFEAIGRLVGGIAHDFNNMIGAILGWAEMGYEETQEDPLPHDRFYKIREQSLRAGKLTAQLLIFAGGQILQSRKLDLNLLVQEEMSLLTRIIGENIKVYVRVAANLRATLADSTQIEQVLMNLCLNARNAMVGGGELTIETQNVELDARFCREHGLDRPGLYISLTVTDTGIGIDAATIGHIFEPFFSTKGSGKGTGLGLATVYGIVKGHGGFISASSVQGAGTSFRVYLPAAVGAHEPCVSARRNRPPTGTETILLAEDHEGLRSTTYEMLLRLGYRVIVACDGKQALELFRKNSRPIDLLITDVVMPSLSGSEAFLQMSALRPNLPVIFMTGYTPEAQVLNSIVEKGAAILQKPYTLLGLSQLVRTVLDRVPALHEVMK